MTRMLRSADFRGFKKIRENPRSFRIRENPRAILI